MIGYTRAERRYLGQFRCDICGRPLNCEHCADYRPRCSAEERDKRRRECLKVAGDLSDGRVR